MFIQIFSQLREGDLVESKLQLFSVHSPTPTPSFLRASLSLIFFMDFSDDIPSIRNNSYSPKGTWMGKLSDVPILKWLLAWFLKYCWQYQKNCWPLPSHACMDSSVPKPSHSQTWLHRGITWGALKTTDAGLQSQRFDL